MTRRPAEGVHVDAGAVVAHGDDDLGPGAARVKQHLRGGRLARGQALLGRLDAVVDGVPHDVHQRFGEFREDGEVEFGLTAAHLPADVLALRPRDVADGAVQSVGECPHRNHPRPGRPFLEFVDDAGQLPELVHLAGVDAHVLRDVRPESQLRARRFPHEPDEFVQPRHRHGKRICGGSGARRCGGVRLSTAARNSRRVSGGRRGNRRGGRLRPAPVRRPVQSGDHRVEVDLVRRPADRGRKDRPDRVDTGKQRVDGARRRSRCTRPDRLEDLLHDVRDPAHVVQPDDGGAALDVVCVTEEAGHEVGVEAVLLQAQQAGSEPIEGCRCLLLEHVPEGGVVARDAHLASSGRSWPTRASAGSRCSSAAMPEPVP